MPRGVPNQPKASQDDGDTATLTRVPPVALNKTIEPLENQIGQDAPRTMKSTGPAREALEPAYIQSVDRPVDEEKLAMMAFMEMPIQVQIHTTTDPTAEQVFEVINGGKREFFRRGETKTVARKFVNILASSKITTYTQKRVRDQEGIMQDVQVPSTALRYPFSVLDDQHPRGADWLRATLAQA